MSAIVATIPSVAHTAVKMMGIVVRTVVRMTSLIETASTIRAPAVSPTVRDIEVRTSEVEVVATRIAGVDAKVPVACIPVQRAIEIGGGTEGFPLPRIENVAEVEVATLPVGTEDVGTARNTHQVVEVDLVGSLILLVGQIQLVCHLVGQEQSFAPGLFVTHCIRPDSHCQHGK